MPETASAEEGGSAFEGRCNRVERAGFVAPLPSRRRCRLKPGLHTRPTVQIAPGGEQAFDMFPVYSYNNGGGERCQTRFLTMQLWLAPARTGSRLRFGSRRKSFQSFSLRQMRQSAAELVRVN